MSQIQNNITTFGANKVVTHEAKQFTFTKHKLNTKAESKDIHQYVRISGNLQTRSVPIVEQGAALKWGITQTGTKHGVRCISKQGLPNLSVVSNSLEMNCCPYDQLKFIRIHTAVDAMKTKGKVRVRLNGRWGSSEWMDTTE
ncbi:hypothetical protein CHS0354_042084 [Potamilus streckersoni]|uniref:Uncharacterized protein n=1 Tax=Potamilus streckersoni TaxID=2493646 RepID=A0AAE0WEQ4_9BIVA|nr:hypothetical protein CHS0354_042084 [Potamilus streckersoni]